MKSLLIRLMPAALLCLALTACGGGGAVGQTPYDPETAAQALLEKGILSKCQYGVKILGNGSISKKLTVQASAFSASAKEKIVAAGGKYEVV